MAPERRRPSSARSQREAMARYEARKQQELQAEQARRERIRRREEKEAESRELARGPIDLPFCLLVLLLTAVGLVMLLSASFPSAYYETDGTNPMHYFVRQGIFAVMGIAAMLFISKINYQRFRGVARLLLFAAVMLLILVIIPGVGITRNNATRWLGFGSLTFQPSEIAKVAVVVYFADSISRKKDKMRTFRYGILPYVLIMGVIACLMMLVGGIRWIWVLAAGGFVTTVATLMLTGVIKYGQSRIAMWQDPFIDPRGDGYQLSQSLISIGSGGLLGVGLGKSRQKFLYLPEEHNDFIFAIICEELGLIGATIIMLLFAALILRGYWIALHARDRFGSLLVVGVMTLIAMQTFLNIGVVTGLLPTTGISLPFFSYGGTALSIQLAEMGIVLSVSRQMKPTKAG